MYEFKEENGRVEVRFKNHFTGADLRRLVQLRFAKKETRRLDDIWVIGSHHARLGMSEILDTVDQLCSLCTCDCSGRRTAFVVDPGLTEGILELLAKGIVRKLPFECRVFYSYEDAEQWLSPSCEMTA